MAQSALRNLQKSLVPDFNRPLPSETMQPTYGVAENVDPSLRERMMMSIYDVLGGSVSPSARARANSYSDIASNLVDWIPTAGEGVGASDAYTDFNRGNYGQAAIGGAATMLGVVPVAGDAAAKAVKKVGNAIRSAEAIKEGAKRGIDLDEADRMQRALDLGYSTQDFYHATMQDLEEFKPIYNNGLTFLTPNAEFANKWLGKGALRTRVGDDSVEAMKKLDRLKLIKKYESEIGVPADSWTGDIWDDYWKKYLSEESKIQREYDNVHKTIYQLRTNVQNTFDPQQHENVVIDLLRSKGVDPQGSFQNGLSNLDAYKQGNYLLYETKPTVDFLKNKGFDSMWLRESTYSPEDIAAPYSTLAVFDPANIRSKSAEFDKGQRLSRNISAGVAGTALGLSALRNINKDNQGAE